MYIVTGNTYPARDMLKNSGFEWDGARKEWTGDEEAMNELKRTSTPTYSRANSNAFAKLNIEKK